MHKFVVKMVVQIDFLTYATSKTCIHVVGIDPTKHRGALGWYKTVLILKPSFKRFKMV